MNTTRWRLLSQLAERAAGHDQPQRLAYGSLEYTDARNGSQMVVYGLAQCTGDLEPSECTSCLMYRLALVSSGNHTGATRASIWGFSCYLRTEVPGERPDHRHRQPGAVSAACCDSIRVGTD